MNEIKIGLNGSLLDTMKYGDVEILNTTKKWSKKSPVLFPAIGLAKEFTIGDKTYKIKRHGFWNDIDFDIKEHDEGFVLSGKIEHETYPFPVEVDQYILVNKNKVSYTTTFTGPEIPMQFGYHPAFNYDKGGLKIKGRAICIMNDLTRKDMDVDITNLSELPWEDVDTFIFETSELTLENNDYNVVVKTNMKYMGVWTNGDKYLCLEPWSNLPALADKDDNMMLDGAPLTMDIIIEEGDK